MTEKNLETLIHGKLVGFVLLPQAEVAELKAKLAGRDYPVKTSSNSSVPPPSDKKGIAEVPEKKNRDAKHGRTDNSRVRMEPDVFDLFIQCRLDACGLSAPEIFQRGADNIERTLGDLFECEMCGVNAQIAEAL